MRRPRGRLVVVAVVLALVATACGGSKHQGGSPVLLPDVRDARAAGCAPGQASPATPAGKALPDLSFECLTGAPSVVSLRDLPARPTVLTLWAHWCGPCKAELPAFQRLYETGKVYVLGVNTLDAASDAVSYLQDLHLSFPSVWDYTRKLLTALPVTIALPVTVFVSAQGVVEKVYQGSAFTDATLHAAVKQYLGVSV